MKNIFGLTVTKFTFPNETEDGEIRFAEKPEAHVQVCATGYILVVTQSNGKMKFHSERRNMTALKPDFVSAGLITA